MDYWRTQWVLKKKWLLNQLFASGSSGFNKFVILCDPRTGSTWLHTLLNSSPFIQSYGEYLTAHKSTGSLTTTIWLAHHPGIGAVGCKVFYEQLLDNRYAPILKEIADNDNIKIIDLTREDQLEMYASLKLAENSKKWSATNSSSPHQSLTLIKEEFEAYTNRIDECRRIISGYLEGHDVYKVTYEQLLNAEDAHLDNIQKFLGVQPKNLFSLLRKQKQLPIESIVENYSEFL